MATWSNEVETPRLLIPPHSLEEQKTERQDGEETEKLFVPLRPDSASLHRIVHDSSVNYPKMVSNGTPRVSGPISGEQLAEIRARIVASNSDSGVSSGQASPARTAQPTSSGLQMPKSGHYEAKETIPNTPLAASVISVTLGAAAGIAATCALQPVLRWLGDANWAWARPQLGIYLTAWATFHILEFWTTAGWNFQKLSVDGE